MKIRTVFLALSLTALVACKPANETPTSTTVTVEKPAVPSTDTPSIVTSLPAAFHGMWDKDEASCNKDESEYRLTLDGKNIKYFESWGDVKWVKVISPTQVEVTSDYDGEGQQWTSTQTFTLSDNGDTLTIKLDGADDTTHHRCGAGKPTATAPRVMLKAVPATFNMPKCTSDKCVKLDIHRMQSSDPWVEKQIDNAILAMGSLQYRGDPTAQSYQELVSNWARDSDKAVAEGAQAYDMKVRPKDLGSWGPLVQVDAFGDTYWGGAHGQPWHEIVVMEPALRQVINLAALTTEGGKTALLKLATKQRLDQLTRRTGSAKLAAEQMKVQSFDLSSNFYLSDKGLTLVYNAGEIDAFAAGEQRIVIPWSELGGIVRDRYRNGK